MRRALALAERGAWPCRAESAGRRGDCARRHDRRRRLAPAVRPSPRRDQRPCRRRARRRAARRSTSRWSRAAITARRRLHRCADPGGHRRVVAAIEDPFPQVAGQGAATLRAPASRSSSALCATEARRHNAPYLKLLATGRPYVHAKWAMSLDGKIATRTGDSQWISNEASRRRVHELRGRMDAHHRRHRHRPGRRSAADRSAAGPRTACRVVLDSQARLASRPSS